VKQWQWQWQWQCLTTGCIASRISVSALAIDLDTAHQTGKLLVSLPTILYLALRNCFKKAL
jgi:hypothetical protein